VGEIQVKLIKVSILLAILTVSCLCIGFAAALNQDEASTHVIFSPESALPGQTVSVVIFFTSTSTDQLQLSYMGLHFDWMPSDQFYGFNLSSAPITYPAGGEPYMFNPINIQIPATASPGLHTYTIGIDGTQGTGDSATPFSWSSTPATLTVLGDGTTSVSPTPTNTNSGGGAPNGLNSVLIFGALGAVIVVIVLLVLVLLVRRRKTQPKPAAKQEAPQSQPETPGESPPKSKPEEDFNI
jgi:hypothetical protein